MFFQKPKSTFDCQDRFLQPPRIKSYWSLFTPQKFATLRLTQSSLPLTATRGGGSKTTPVPSRTLKGAARGLPADFPQPLAKEPWMTSWHPGFLTPKAAPRAPQEHPKAAPKSMPLVCQGPTLPKNGTPAPGVGILNGRDRICLVFVFPPVYYESIPTFSIRPHPKSKSLHVNQAVRVHQYLGATTKK